MKTKIICSTMLARVLIPALFLCSVTATVNAHDRNANSREAITFHSTNLFPESVTWSEKKQRFYVGSVKRGIVGEVDKQGNFRELIRNKNLVSTLGVRADDSSNTLWVINADFGFSEKSKKETLNKIAGVGKFDLSTGKLIKYYDLSPFMNGPRLLNDIAVDENGNAYVTESFKSKLFKISGDSIQEVHLQSDMLKPSEGYNLNGIIYAGNGALLVGKHNTGEIFKINIHKQNEVSKVRLVGDVIGLDGITMKDKQNIIGILNLKKHQAVNITSKDNWNSAVVTKVFETKYELPSAVTMSGKEAWVLNGRLGEVSANAPKKTSNFMLQRFK